MRALHPALAAIAIVATALAASPAPATFAYGKECLVRNTTKKTSHLTLLEAVALAAPGNTLRLQGLCNGPVSIDKSLTINGYRAGTKGTPSWSGIPTITGLDAERPVEVTMPSAVVRFNRLTVRDGEAGDGEGGAIRSVGTLILTDVVVASSHAGTGGGVWTSGPLTLKGASRVRGNRAFTGGGISVRAGLTTIGGHTVISGNRAGGDGSALQVRSSDGTARATIKDDAVVRGNGVTGGGPLILVLGEDGGNAARVTLTGRAVIRSNDLSNKPGTSIVELSSLGDAVSFTMAKEARIRDNRLGAGGAVVLEHTNCGGDPVVTLVGPRITNNLIGAAPAPKHKQIAGPC